MTDLRQAAMQALEALEDERYVTKYTHIVEAINALRAALEQPEQEPEPVAWMSASGDWVTRSKPVMENHASKGTVFVPLYK
jgi:hypothetical protein